MSDLPSPLAMPLPVGLEAQMATLILENRYLRRDIESLRADLDVNKKEMTELKGLVNKYRGGVAVILAVGGFVGWLVSSAISGAKLWT